MNIYLPHINSKTAFGHVMRIMTTEDKNLSENELKLKRSRTKKLNKDKAIRSASDFRNFARSAFGRKEAKK